MQKLMHRVEEEAAAMGESERQTGALGERKRRKGRELATTTLQVQRVRCELCALAQKSRRARNAYLLCRSAAIGGRPAARKSYMRALRASESAASSRARPAAVCSRSTRGKDSQFY